MTDTHLHGPALTDKPAPSRPARSAGTPALTWRSPWRPVLALVIGLLIYLSLYAYVEGLTWRMAESNRFYRILTAEPPVKLVILGASRALPLEYGSMGEELEAALGGTVLNLAVQGGGVLPNAILADYVLRRHQPETVVYVLDSFVCYSPEWNERRLMDQAFWRRAPFDWALVRSLWEAVFRIRIDWRVVVAYVSGFWKLNDPGEWFQPDALPGEEMFTRVYRPSGRADQERLQRLYLDGTPQESFQRYFSVFLGLLERLGQQGTSVVVVKPPLRQAFYDALPGEAEFDQMVGQALAQRGIPFHDFSRAGFPDDHFYDPDHLNETGAQRFIHEYLLPLLITGSGHG